MHSAVAKEKGPAEGRQAETVAGEETTKACEARKEVKAGQREARKEAMTSEIIACFVT